MRRQIGQRMTSQPSPSPARTATVGLAVNLGEVDVSPGTNRIITSGYARARIGGGTYVADGWATLMLAMTYPRCVLRTRSGRYFRLAGPAVTTAQTGATGRAGTNDQPAVDQLLRYAAAVGIEDVRFSHATCEMWCPRRTSDTGKGGLNDDGVPMVIRENMALRGVPGGTTITLKNSLGGSKNIATQTGIVGIGTWQGGGIYVHPNHEMDWVIIEDLIVDGGVTYNPADRSNVNLSDKGFRIQDARVAQVTMRRCTFRNFGGEIYYLGGRHGIDTELIEDCVFEGSPQCALNPGTGSKGTYNNVTTGHAYQNEILGGQGRTFTNCRFHDLRGVSVAGGAGAAPPGVAAGYNFTYPYRDPAKPPPWVTFTDCTFERIATTVNTGSYVRGNVTLIDGEWGLTNFGKLEDIDLKIEARSDGRNIDAVLNIGGPPDLTTRVHDTPAGVMMETPRRVSVEVHGGRSVNAMAKGYRISNLLRLFGGLLDSESCHFILSGAADRPFTVLGTLPPTFEWPMIDVLDSFTPTTPAGFGGSFAQVAPRSDFTVALMPGLFVISPEPRAPGSGPLAMTIGQVHPCQDGQQVTVFLQAGAGDHPVSIAASGAGARLSNDRMLWRTGDRLTLHWDARSRLWVEDGYFTQVPAMSSGRVGFRG
jgi:hypothetical protein